MSIASDVKALRSEVNMLRLLLEHEQSIRIQRLLRNAKRKKQSKFNLHIGDRVERVVSDKPKQYKVGTVTDISRDGEEVEIDGKWFGINDFFQFVTTMLKDGKL